MLWRQVVAKVLARRGQHAIGDDTDMLEPLGAERYVVALGEHRSDLLALSQF